MRANIFSTQQCLSSAVYLTNNQKKNYFYIAYMVKIHSNFTKKKQINETYALIASQYIYTRRFHYIFHCGIYQYLFIFAAWRSTIRAQNRFAQLLAKNGISPKLPHKKTNILEMNQHRWLHLCAKRSNSLNLHGRWLYIRVFVNTILPFFTCVCSLFAKTIPTCGSTWVANFKLTPTQQCELHGAHRMCAHFYETNFFLRFFLADHINTLYTL